MKKKCSVQHTKEARINQLPDELLITILSRLTLREAVATSVLSRRWRTMWTHTTGSLHFDALKETKKVRVPFDPMRQEDYERITAALAEAENSRFVAWVDRVLDMHQASIISEFKVKHQVTRTPSCPRLDKWIQTAIEKRVQNLHLLLATHTWCISTSCQYILPSPHISDFVRSPSGLAGIRSLVSLSLSSVNVTSAFLEYIAQVCPLLERISLIWACNLDHISLNVGHPSSRLKFLSIKNCTPVTGIKVSAPGFTTFKYLGGKTELEFVSTPLLTDISIIPNAPQHAHYVFAPLSTYLTQLQSLQFGISLTKKDVPEFPHLPLLKNLRYLSLHVMVIYERSLLSYVSLIEASPYLQKFTLEVLHSRRPLVVEKLKLKNRNLSPRNGCLKVIEFPDFAGSEMEMEIALYLLEAASNLEKLFITYGLFSVGEQTKRAALYLQKYLPHGAELVETANVI